MPSITVAAAQHANRHAYNGGDPLSPESIHAAPLKHLHEIADVNELAESLSAAYTTSDTGWRLVSPENGWTGEIRLRRVGSIVHFRTRALNGTAATSSNVILLPSGFHPGPNMPAHGMGNKSSNAASGSDPIGAVGGANNQLVRTFGSIASWTGGSASIEWMTLDPWPTTLPGTPAGGGNSEGGPLPSVAWSNVIGKPTEFTPSAHLHEVGDITGSVKTVNDLPPDASGNIVIDIPEITWSAVTGKPTTFAPAPHDHSMANVTGLSTALDGKAAKTHTHTKAQVSGLPTIYTTIVDVRVSNSINGNVILDWPSGLFSSAPVVTTSAIGQFYAATTGTPNTNSCNIAVRHVDNTVDTNTVRVNVIAVLI